LFFLEQLIVMFLRHGGEYGEQNDIIINENFLIFLNFNEEFLVSLCSGYSFAP